MALVRKGKRKKVETGIIEPLGLGFHGRSPFLVYQEINKKGDPELFLQKSDKGVRFDKPRKKLRMLSERGSIEDVSFLSRLHATPTDEGVFLTYTKRIGRSTQVMGAISKDLSTWRAKRKIVDGSEDVILLSDFLHKDKYVAYASGAGITMLASSDLRSWRKTATGIPGGRLWGAFNIPSGILVLVDRSIPAALGTTLRVEGYLMRQDNPAEIAWQGESFIFEENVSDTNTTPLGALLIGKSIRLYWLTGDKKMHTAAIPQPFEGQMEVGKASLTKVHHANPILSPTKHHFESVATFNPAALYDGERVHLLYRAIGSNDMSSVGYATSTDGINFTERLPHPIYSAKNPSEGTNTVAWQVTDEYTSGGGGWGGCEDPRITLLDGRVYMTYVAYNGYEAPRVAITSIAFDDFKAGKWRWKKPLLISKPHQVNKNAAILPEKINGKYVIFHRIFPDILIDFVDDLDFKKKRWLTGDHKIRPRASFWDSRKLGVGPPPLKVDAGWLVIYQGVDDRDPGRYKMGAMILAEDDPTKVLYRARLPIAVPDAEYDNVGHKWGVIYPCGAAVIKKQLYIYYGGADRVTCVAHTPLDQFVENIKNDSVVQVAVTEVKVKK